MSEPIQPDVVVHICSNCIPQGGRLPSQWTQSGARVLVREVPCSGKIDGQYLMHTFEGGASGLCIVSCPEGECRLAQGNYRAEVRMRTVQRLLSEIGLEPERIELLHSSPDDTFDRLEKRIREVIERFCMLGETSIHTRFCKQQSDNG
ncbi:MAG: hydrogenase iron-sulfur subunit [Planctomycetota bacterium]|nr:MAG: hydrogenase iron-sulfur subunit [Planctomycetota bacterium]